METPFRDRTEAGQQLGELLSPYAGRDDVLILALPRGGIPVALAVARALDVPMDILNVRKLGYPGQEELAMGAIATGGIRVVNDEVVRMLQIPQDVIDRAAEEESHELERREQVYRGGRPPPDLQGRTVILIDDGIATGSTIRAAIAAVRQQGPARVVVAIPVAPAEVCEQLRREADEVVCLRAPEAFLAIGLFYESFPQLTDEEVRQLLAVAPAPKDQRQRE